MVIDIVNPRISRRVRWDPHPSSVVSTIRTGQVGATHPLSCFANIAVGYVSMVLSVHMPIRVPSLNVIPRNRTGVHWVMSATLYQIGHAIIVKN